MTLDPSEIVAIHRITGKRDLPRPILVTFLRMESKIAMMKKRKELVDKMEIKIVDDVTQKNQGLLNRLYLHEEIADA